MAGRMIIVSNRLPVTVTKREGKFFFNPSAGGLATGLGSFYRETGGVWLGWPGISLESARGHEEDIITKLGELSCKPVFLSKRLIEKYYYGFSNKTLWPLFHYFLQYAVFDQKFWESYRRANRLFCEAVLEVAEPDSTIWVHDYQLLLLPQMLREKLPQATIGFFLHIPFPSYEIFRVLPWREEILKGLLGADLIGFHTYDYVRHFISSVRRILGFEHSLGIITTEDRVLRVDAFPMGIDYEKFAYAPEKKEVRQEIKRIKRRTGNRKVILSVDRLDYTKGIAERLKAYDQFLEKYPSYKEKVVLILVAVPSRTRVEHYMLLKKEVDELIGRINGRHGAFGWTPVWYLYRSLPFHTLAALYHIADVALVTPFRDGMNLIAKEYVATTSADHGMLVLSEMAGAASELGEAIIINPYNFSQMIEALREALEMAPEEKSLRNYLMKNRLRRYNVNRWAHEFMEKLYEIKEAQQAFVATNITKELLKEIKENFDKAAERIEFLDYDGTLVNFAGRPEAARPDEDLLNLLRKLTEIPKNEVVLISGRDKDTLEAWFGNIPLNLVAEHGVWIKEARGEWQMIEAISLDWKEAIRPVMENFADITPGAFIEEKDYALVWHYRKADPELSAQRARELKEALFDITQNLDLMVLEGNKVIEVKPVNINKGRAAKYFLEKKNFDFILAVGDDWTDEDLFEVMPEHAYTIKVGFGVSRARYRAKNPQEVRKILKTLVT
ncbi:alpha,alpha-trehalose-phosphate synthase (UDP-forming) [Thermodesulfatator indicus DSM 15286]|uniref:Alpha,alpha-trehalose-phosphate synthase n=1 Tax=Thermodesulfatator indicus (strain DSM 15286 / JCM 11887 / CIR29812) TaxID=667014 RepID=F8A880_THEID|nr:bifunctional alpha,alpha-trehalose-phosphate synthase (UDP-forming)/trehalose-phosphatase [Thermodesulfatator indicus]AEH44473.1 alpha,alpha-trehalose-phosphate synthase (UDP-forming) [Thermodesulfatator indicus DSM 15286]